MSQPDSSTTKNSLAVKAKVLIVDDHELLRYGLRILISSDPALVVCGDAADHAAALEISARKRPDVAVVDISLGADSGLDLIGALAERCPEMKAVVCTLHEERIYGERALRAGAQGYVCKQDPARTVLEAIHRVLDGELFFSQELTERMLRRLARRRRGRDAASRLALRPRIGGIPLDRPRFDGP